MGFMALWLWLAWTLPIVAWLVWIGDNEHWFWRASVWVAGTVVVLWHALVFPRMVRGRVSRRFLRWHGLATVALWLLAAAVWSVEFINPILAADPRRAAEEKIKGIGYGEPVRLVEIPVNESEWAHPSQMREFLILGQHEPRGRVAVTKYGRFWWTHGRYIGYPDSSKEIQRARKLLLEPKSREMARVVLQEVINVRPDTAAAKEAEDLLRGNGLQTTPPADLKAGLDKMHRP
jgi:hypothetical protein